MQVEILTMLAHPQQAVPRAENNFTTYLSGSSKLNNLWHEELLSQPP